MKRNCKLKLFSVALLSALSCTSFINRAVSLDIPGDTSNPITISSSDSSVNVTGNASSTGIITVESNGTINVSPSVTFSQNSYFNSASAYTITKTGAGTFNLKAPYTSSAYSTFSGTIAVQEGTVNVFGGVDTLGYNNRQISFFVGTADGSGTGAKLVLGSTTSSTTRPLYVNQADAKIYSNGEVVIAAGDTHFAWGHTLEFVGGGKITANTSGTADPYFTIRGAETIKVSGADAHASIGATIWSYGGETKTFDIADSSSDLTITSNIIRGDSAPILKKTGAGTLILSGTDSNYQGTTLIEQGVIRATSAAAFGSSSVQIGANGTLAWNVAPSNMIANFANQISGTGNLYLDNAVIL